MKKTITAAIFLFALTASAAFGQTTADEWYTKAGEYFESGDHANAITAYSETIKRDSSNVNAYWFRGIVYSRIKNYDAAIADYNTVIKDAPDFPDAYILRGDAYGAKGAYHTAVADYKRGLEKGSDPNGFGVDKSSKADMWFCGAMFMEITVNRFLGKPDVVAKYENWLKTVCDKSGLTRAEVEAFYRQNIGALVAQTVDAEFNKVSGFMVKTDTDDANVELIRKQNEYILICDGYWGNPKKEEIKQFSASSVDALITVMRNSGNFSATALNQVRAQAALIPAVVFDGWKRTTPNMVNPYELLTNALTDFYKEPSRRNYEIVRGILARAVLASVTDGDAFTDRMTESIHGILVAFNLNDKMNGDIDTTSKMIAAANIPDDPRYGIFTLTKATGDAIFVSKRKSAPGLLVR